MLPSKELPKNVRRRQTVLLRHLREHRSFIGRESDGYDCGSLNRSHRRITYAKKTNPATSLGVDFEMPALDSDFGHRALFELKHSISDRRLQAMTAPAWSDLVRERRAFRFTAKFDPKKSGSRERAIAALERQAGEVFRIDHDWSASLSESSPSGSLNLHMRPVKREEVAASVVGGLAASIIVGTFAGVIGNAASFR